METINNFDLHLLNYPKVVITMDTYKYGKIKKSLPYEMGFGDAFKYL